MQNVSRSCAELQTRQERHTHTHIHRADLCALCNDPLFRLGNRLARRGKYVLANRIAREYVHPWPCVTQRCFAKCRITCRARQFTRDAVTSCSFPFLLSLFHLSIRAIHSNTTSVLTSLPSSSCLSFIFTSPYRVIVLKGRNCSTSIFLGSSRATAR